MGEWFNARREAMTLERYRQLDAEGKITRPLTLGGIQPRLTVQDAIDVLGLGELGIRPMSDATRNRKHRERKAA